MVGAKISISVNPTAPKKLVKVTLDFSFTGHCFSNPKYVFPQTGCPQR